MLFPLLPVYVAAPWWPAPESVQETDDVCTDVGSSVETECPHSRKTGDEDWQLHEVYEKPMAIHEYEGGLWLKATHMPLLDTCYIESDTGYRPFGSVADFWRLAETMDNGLVVVTESCVHIMRKGEDAEAMALKPGLRHLRCYPCNVGIMMLGEEQRRFAYLEATWRRDDKRAGRPKIETELVMSMLRSRDNHICCW